MQKKETAVSLKLITFVLLMYKQLTSEQRYAISWLLQQGQRKKETVKVIGVKVSTVYRKLQRNKTKRGGYGWPLAQEMSDEKKCRLPGNRKIKESICREALKLLKDYLQRFRD